MRDRLIYKAKCEIQLNIVNITDDSIIRNMRVSDKLIVKTGDIIFLNKVEEFTQHTLVKILRSNGDVFKKIPMCTYITYSVDSFSNMWLGDIQDDVTITSKFFTDITNAYIRNQKLKKILDEK